MEIFDKIKNKYNEYISLENQFKRSKNTPFNQKARKEFENRIKSFNLNDNIPSEENEAIIYSQAFEFQQLKNPASAKFPNLEDYEIENDGTCYTIKGYVDATNSYGAQIRTQTIFKAKKIDGEWTIIDNTKLNWWVWLIVVSIIIALPSIMVSCLY